MSIDKNLITKFLKTKFIGKNIVSLNETDSTNTRVKYAAELNAENGTVIIAENQTAGKGTKGHMWLSDPGKNILMSILLYTDDISPHFLPTLTLGVGLAVSTSLEKIAKIQTNLKWPNDVFVQGKKICGILCEKFITNNRDCVAIGIGVNIHSTIFPKSIADKATSLFILKEKKFDREKIIAQILNETENIYYKLYLGFIDEIIKAYRPKCISIGKNIEVVKNNCRFRGIVDNISCTGELIAINKSGEKFALNSLENINQEIY